MALSDTWLKANHGKIREKSEEKPDRDAMSVRVTPKGKITFQIRFRHEGRHARIDIGSYPAVSLKDARERAVQIKGLIEQGIDPRVERQLQKHQATAANLSLIELFGQWNDKYLERSKRSHNEIRRSFEIHVFDHLGELPADRLTMGHWLSVLEPLADDKPAIAAKILANAKQMMVWAVRRQLCVNNTVANIDPSDDLHLEFVPKDRVLADDEIAMLWRAIMRSRMSIRNRIFLQLCMIYGCRSGELRATEKHHIDRVSMVWTIPPENHKMGEKTGKPIVRPIIPETLQLFDLAATLNDTAYMFVSTRDKASLISRGALLGLPYDIISYLEREEDVKMPHWSLHDLRRTMRTNMSSLAEPHIAEIMLGHALPLMWRTYDKHDYLDEQRQALVKWCERLRGIIAPYPLV